jgi:replication factor A1
MDENNYYKFLERVSRVSSMQKEEIDRRVDAKQAKLSGLISREGALQIIAGEMGIDFDSERFKIDEIIPGLKKINVVGKILKLFPVRTFTTKKGEEGKVANLILADDTSNIKVVLWDTNHISLIENGSISEGSMIEISNGSVRLNEIHLGSFSQLKITNESFEKIVTERIVKEKKISEFAVGDRVKIRAFIVQAFEPKFFYVCQECKKKATQESEGIFSCAEHGRISPEKRALVNLVIDDGTGTIRAVLFHENISAIGITDLENFEKLSEQRQNLLGKEIIFLGNVKMNTYFNNLEFIADDVEEINYDELLKVLEKI